ncbi:uncharacterized protein B0H18DRAFT_974366 [Fomitopsis serialis]|uniref:uncharacterized protein n=1 Tax=Fomitopsis serialis TaxID=139415 RepID=UPI0020088D7C|nr:uncharacterized protein B0H18DRAFT_974366 [Neoantrodia serialis]KAH9936551.1 hypothetical protein B0H18DRAFT_974366 [Neoantrodia serialis]
MTHAVLSSRTIAPGGCFSASKMCSGSNAKVVSPRDSYVGSAPVRAYFSNGLWRLPLELWCIIIEHLEGCDEALKACSSTCGAWRRPARQVFFRTMHVPQWPPKRPAEIPPRLRTLLAEQPEIAKLVRTMRVDLAFQELPWLSAFTNLRFLDLYLDGIHGRVPSESALDGLHLPHLTTLAVFLDVSPSLSSCERLMACCPHLTDLMMQGAPYGRIEEFAHIQVEEQPIATPLSLPRLRKVSFTAPGFERSFTKILRLAGDSLTCAHLATPLTPTLDLLRDMLDFSHNTHLEDLEIEMDAPILEDGWGDYPAALLSRINTSHSSLTRLYLSIPRFCLGLVSSTGRWAEVGQCLGRELSRVLDSMPHVTVVILWLKFPIYVGQEHSTVADCLLRQFPGLSAHSDRVCLHDPVHSAADDPDNHPLAHKTGL